MPNVTSLASNNATGVGKNDGGRRKQTLFLFIRFDSFRFDSATIKMSFFRGVVYHTICAKIIHARDKLNIDHTMEIAGFNDNIHMPDIHKLPNNLTCLGWLCIESCISKSICHESN